MSLVSTNQPYRKVMIINKYNYQDNHQSYSSIPNAVGNILKPSLWVDRIICSAKVSKLVEEGRHLEKFQRFLFFLQ